LLKLAAVIFKALVKPGVPFGLSKKVTCPATLAFGAAVGDGVTAAGVWFLKANAAATEPAASSTSTRPTMKALRQVFLSEVEGEGEKPGVGVCGVCGC
jgi:hypothetical protein